MFLVYCSHKWVAIMRTCQQDWTKEKWTCQQDGNKEKGLETFLAWYTTHTT